jgi:hypothetical protein
MAGIVLTFPSGMRDERPEFTFKVIETLLPTANYNIDTGRGKLLEL